MNIIEHISIHMCMTLEVISGGTAGPQGTRMFNFAMLPGNARLFSKVAVPTDSHDVLTFSPIGNSSLMIFCLEYCIYVQK